MGNCLESIRKKTTLTVTGSKEKENHDHPLPWDLAPDILSALPLKTLSRFRCLSKPWRDMIADATHQNLILFFISSIPASCTEWTLRFTSVDTTTGTVLDSFTAGSTLDLPIVSVLPTCWDLVCFATQNHIFLCNPTSHRILNLRGGSGPDQVVAGFGFGFFPSTDEYKVVRLIRPLSPKSPAVLECEILTLHGRGRGRGRGRGSILLANGIVTKCCRRLARGKCPYAVIQETDSAFVDGRVNWRISPEVCTENSYIVSLDLRSDCFSTIPAPAGFSKLKLSMKELASLVEVGGRLCIVDSFCGRKKLTMQIWMLKDYESGIWVKQYKINMAAVANPNRLLFWWEPWDVMPRFIMGEEIVASDKSTVYSYNIRTGTWRTLRSRQSLGKFSFYYSRGFK